MPHSAFARFVTSVRNWAAGIRRVKGVRRLGTVPIPLWVKRAVDAWTVSAQITDGHEVEDHSQFYSIVRLSPGHRPSLHKPTERPKFERYHQGDGLDHRTNVQFYERESDTGARRIFDDVIRSAAERKPICLPLPLLPAVGERDLRETEHGIHIPAIESFDESLGLFDITDVNGPWQDAANNAARNAHRSGRFRTPGGH